MVPFGRFMLVLFVSALLVENTEAVHQPQLKTLTSTGSSRNANGGDGQIVTAAGIEGDGRIIAAPATQAITGHTALTIGGDAVLSEDESGKQLVDNDDKDGKLAQGWWHRHRRRRSRQARINRGIAAGIRAWKRRWAARWKRQFKKKNAKRGKGGRRGRKLNSSFTCSGEARPLQFLLSKQASEAPCDFTGISEKGHIDDLDKH